MMKERIVRLKKRVSLLYSRNMQLIRERGQKNQKSQLQIALMSGSIKRIK